MKKNLLIVGDSFSADWTVKYQGWGWVNRLTEYNVTNLSQAGASEYKIYKQLATVDVKKFDMVVICHTSPFRIPILQHPVHSGDKLHGNCDLIYNDLLQYRKNKLVNVAVEFFENFFDQAYANFVHDLLINELIKMFPKALHITFFESTRTDVVNFYNFFQKHRGLINHLSEEGNKQILQIITELLQKYDQSNSITV